MPDQKIQSVTCKRQVLLKTIVTENFKIDLALDLQNNIKNFQNNMQQLDNVLKQLESRMENKGDTSQLENEKRKMIAQIKILEDKLADVKHLKHGEIYVNGMIEGFANISKGDDLRTKLGTAEILSKDYIVQDVKVVLPDEKKEVFKPEIIPARSKK